MQSTADQAAAIREARQAIHGDPRDNGRNTGMQWAALINEYFRLELPPLPPHLVFLMMVEFKIGRAARPWPKPDNDDYKDALNYLAFAEENAPNLPGSKPQPSPKPVDMEAEADPLPEVINREEAFQSRAKIDAAATHVLHSDDLYFRTEGHPPTIGEWLWHRDAYLPKDEAAAEVVRQYFRCKLALEKPGTPGDGRSGSSEVMPEAPATIPMPSDHCPRPVIGKRTAQPVITRHFRRIHFSGGPWHGQSLEVDPSCRQIAVHAAAEQLTGMAEKPPQEGLMLQSMRHLGVYEPLAWEPDSHWRFKQAHYTA